ncbi:HlyD family efflux transporter periplasmic adaptor subunit [Sphingoaurantiacus capsulatus]|uniref:HlyD family efflux transporter periplasmic adaptor subunit n=1 Tax=Sphingoaurantiacus capsulatus TaxID=1771310 RepID=A0ABV7X9M3_9SPHN
MGRLEGIARSRPVRVALIISLATFGGWSFAPYVMGDVSTRAAVNAPIIRLTAVVEGTVPELPAVGSYYAAPARLSIVTPSHDTGDVAQFKADAELATAALALAERQLAELSSEEVRLAGRAQVFSTASARRLNAEIRATGASASACDSEKSASQAALVRAEKLMASGFMTAAGLERARSAAAMAAGSCDAEKARLGSFQAMREAAARGVYIGDGYNDAPYAEQQRDRLMLQRQQLEQIVSEQTAKRTEALRRWAEANARAHFAAPPGTLVWSQLASPGAAVRAGEPVLDLVDCRRRFVEVALPERRAEAIRPGNKAEVRLIGSDGWQSGRVARVAGAAAQRSDTLFAAKTSSLPSDREISVEVTLDTPAHGSPERRCDVGRLAEVRFG